MIGAIIADNAAQAVRGAALPTGLLEMLGLGAPGLRFSRSLLLSADDGKKSSSAWQAPRKTRLQFVTYFLALLPAKRYGTLVSYDLSVGQQRERGEKGGRGKGRRKRKEGKEGENITLRGRLRVSPPHQPCCARID